MYQVVTYENAFVALFIIYCIYFFDVFHSTMNIVSVKTRKLQSLAQLVRTQYKNIFMVIWVCMSIIVKNTYITLAQKLNKTLVRIDKNTYEVTYVINGIQYVMHIKTKKGPKRLIQALDKDDNDITEKIQSYLGPMENFHGHAYTPRFFNTDEITINLSSGQDLVFRDEETIVI